MALRTGVPAVPISSVPRPGAFAKRDFFVSHAGPDSDWAEWIAKTLVDAGYSVELDVWDWAAGTNFVAAMERALDGARRMIAVMSPAYFERTWTRVERFAAFAVAAESDGFLVPVLVATCEEVPRLFHPLIWIELVGLTEPAARVKLLDGVAPAGRKATTGQITFPGAAAFPGGLTAVRNLPARNLFFTGRQPHLERLAGRLSEDGGTGRVAISAVRGVGGVGKSQLALEYAWRHADAYPTAIWWLNAEDPAGLAAGMLELAVAFALVTDGGPRAVRRRVGAELGRRGDFLLIYDNVEDLDLLEDLPAGGHILLTTRLPTVAEQMPTLSLEVFPRSEAVQLLRRRVPDLSAADADRLAVAVGDLPLAVAQAGAYLADTGTTPTAYLTELAARQEVNEPDGLRSTVTTALVELADRDPAALGLLRQLAYLAPEPIPLTAHATAEANTSVGGLAVADPATTSEIIDAITRLDLARRSGTHLLLHRRVRTLIADTIPADRRRSVLTRTLRMMATSHPGDPVIPAHWAAYADLTPHVTALSDLLHDPQMSEPPGFRRLLLDVCRYLSSSGQYQQAHQLASRTRTRWTTALGPDHPDTLSSASNVAIDLAALGDNQAARALDEDTLTRRRRVLGDDNPETLRSAHGLSIRLAALGDLHAARTLTEDTHTRLHRLLGPDDPDTLRSANSLAIRLAALGELKAARTLDEDTLTRRRRALGDDHPETLTSASNLAIRLAALGEIQAARILDEDTLQRRRRVFGDSHPETLRSANNLAVRLAALGELEAARALNEDTLTRRRRLLGDDHPDTLTSAHFLATDLAALGQLQAAHTLNEDTLTRRRRLLGEDHPDTLTSANSLASDLSALGEHQAAQTLAEDTLTRRRRILGDDHPDTHQSEQLLREVQEHGRRPADR